MLVSQHMIYGSFHDCNKTENNNETVVLTETDNVIKKNVVLHKYKYKWFHFI